MVSGGGIYSLWRPMNQILRSDLLQGRSVLLEALPRSGLERGLREVGAQVSSWPGSGEAEAEGEGPAQAVDALVIDCSGWVPEGGPPAPLQQLLDRIWQAVEAVANRAFIPAGEGGQILFVAPAQRELFAVPAAVAALENLGRTLSVEWARHRITVCTVAPSARTTDAHLATLVAYLLSSAGAYFSGTRLDLNALPG